MGLELLSAGELSDAELAALFTASYEGYLVPFAVDAATVRFMTEVYDLDRAASRVAVRDGERVGLANLGLRGADAWIGGIGVVPGERGRGTGRLLMAALHNEGQERGAERVWLEVIVENARAIALYEALGYANVRDLEVWSLPGDGGEAAPDAGMSKAHEWIQARRTEREPWQRADGSLAKIPGVQGLVVDGAAAVLRVSGDRVAILQIEGTEEPLRRLLEAVRSLGESVSVLNLPVGHAAGPVLEELGGRADVRQHEMVLEL
jgi:ribosomal protein S18 acetylase RimI-like enzyme